jgi:hypothetical protein
MAVVNGQVQGEKTFAVLPDLNKGKDAIGRINYNFGPFDIGMSGMVGQGQIVDGPTLRFKQFGRYAINGEVGFHHAFSKELGMTKVYAEMTRARNYDRGTKYGAGMGLPTFPTDIVNNNVDDRDEFAWWVRVEQDFTHWFTLALRYDIYTPDMGLGENSRDTFGAVSVVHFTKGLQWMLEYNHYTDNVHLLGKVPPSKHADLVSNVLQVRF